MPIKGLDTTLKALQQYSAKVQQEIKVAVEDTTNKIYRLAESRAPAAGDRLITQHDKVENGKISTKFGSQISNTGINQFIFTELKNNGFTGVIYVDDRATKLAIYVEFGTGRSAAAYVPTLDPEFQEIAMNYYVNGKGTLIKQPFLLPSYFDEAPKLIEEIKAILKNAT